MIQRLLTNAAIAVAAAVTPLLPAVAAPPAPVIPPPGVEQPIRGYDLRIPFQHWRYWVERQKGPVVEALMAEPEAIEGERPVGARLVRFVRSNDFGPYLVGDIHRYCRRQGADGFDPDSCHYRLRRAYVPHDAGSSQEDNPVARWMRDAFDVERLARHLRSEGLPPNSDWWRVDLARMFSALPSPAPVLRENAQIVRVDSRECPAFADALAALDSRRIDWRFDLFGVGEDTRVDPPIPHALTTEFRYQLLVPGRAGLVTIQGGGSAMEELFAPVAAALDACERAVRPTQ